MHLKSILRRVHPIPGFVYGRIELQWERKSMINVHVRPRAGSRGVCSGCGKKRRGYDTLTPRQFAFVPLWGMIVYLIYAMRRVDCPHCGVTVELVPWATGKSPLTHAYCWFLADWAKVLSWKETARRFRTSWDTVFHAVEHAVRWGLANRSLSEVYAIGVDELSWKKGHKYLTMVYQLDHGCRRLLHISRQRTSASFTRCSKAIHVLDRFHVMQLMSKAVDQTRRDEVRQLRAKGKHAVLTKTRWIMLKNPIKFTDGQRDRLRELLKCNLKTIRAFLLKQSFQDFWKYKAVWAAQRFLKDWTTRAMRSRNPHFKRFAQTLRDHEPELLNWFRARGKFAAGATEGFNNKARITTRKAYGFRTYEHAEIALYHGLGNLPTPDWLTHRFV